MKDKAIKIIFGLGNHGEVYQKNRHNIGMMVVNHLAKKLDLKFKSETLERIFIAKTTLDPPNPVNSSKDEGRECQVILVLSKNFINLSGTPLAKILSYYKVEIENVLVIHDEIELPFSNIRMKRGGGHHGHNGLRDIIAHCGAHFDRLSFGVGRPEHKSQVADYVLSDFSKIEEKELNALIETACSLTMDWVHGSLVI